MKGKEQTDICQGYSGKGQDIPGSGNSYVGLEMREGCISWGQW